MATVEKKRGNDYVTAITNPAWKEITIRAETARGDVLVQTFTFEELGVKTST